MSLTYDHTETHKQRRGNINLIFSVEKGELVCGNVSMFGMSLLHVCTHGQDVDTAANDAFFLHVHKMDSRPYTDPP